MIIIKKLVITLLFTSVYLHAQKDEVSRIKSMPADNKKVQQIVSLINSTELEDIKPALELCNEGISIAEKNVDIKSLVHLHRCMALLWLDISAYAKAAESSNKAWQYARDLGDFKLQATVLSELGENARARSDLDLSVKYLYEGYSILQKIQNRELACYIENRIAAVYFELFTNFTKGNVVFDSTVATVYYNAKIKRWVRRDYLDSLNKYIDLSLRNAEALSDTELVNSGLNIKGAMHEVLGEYKEAMDVLTTGLALARKINSLYGEVEILRNLSMVHWKLQKKEEAIRDLLQAYELVGIQGDKVVRKELAQRLSDFYREIGDITQAYKFLKIAHDLVLEVYDTDLRVKLMQERTVQEQQLNAEKIALQEKISLYLAIIFGVVILLILILVFLLYLRNKNMKIINRDLTALNKTISLQHEELHALNVEKDKFFSIVAHDLKGPITGLKGFSEMLIEDYHSLNEGERKQNLQDINRAIHSLSDLTENLLRWAELQLKRIKPHPENFDVRDLLQITKGALSTNIISKELQINDSLVHPVMVHADKNAIQSVLHNIIANAIKFTPRGGIVSIASIQSAKHITICIQDGGEGVPEKVRERIFRLDKHISIPGTEGEKGTGLGLLICKEMIEQNGGNIWVENTSNSGAAFYFTIPAVTGANTKQEII